MGGKRTQGSYGCRVKVLAKISLLPTEAGGRTEPIIGSFRPNHSFSPGMFVIGQVEHRPGAELFPGESADLVVDFIPDGVPALTPGTKWNLYDGPSHLIGSATLLRVIAD